MKLNENEYIETCFPTSGRHSIINVLIYDMVKGKYRIDALLFDDWIKSPEIHAILRPLALLNETLKSEVERLIRNKK